MYKPVSVHLSENQKNKIRKSVAQGKEFTIDINKVGGDDKLFLTDTQIKKLNKNGKARIKFSKTQMQHQKGGFLGPLISGFVKMAPTLFKSVLAPLGLAAASGAISGAAYRKTKGKGIHLNMNSSDVNKLLKQVEALKNENVITNQVFNKVISDLKKQQGGFLPMLLGSLAASLLPSLFSGQGLYRSGGKGLKKKL